MRKSIFSTLLAVIAIGVFALFRSAHAQDVTYTVQPGDSLSSIAASQLGDPNKWQQIYSLNQSQIQNPNLIFVGESLIISSTPDSSDANTNGNNTVTQSVSTEQVPVVMYTPHQYVSPVHSSDPSGASNYQGMINDAASQYGVSAALMNKIISCESGYNPNAYNPSGATGIAQFMPGTYYGSWNPYKSQYSLSSAKGQIYAMALKIHLGGVNSWVCARL